MSLGTIGQKNLEQALANSLSPSLYQGVVLNVQRADDGFIDDTLGGFAPNQWAGYSMQFSPYTETAALRGVWMKISSNTAATLFLETGLPAAPQPGDQYTIRSFFGIGAAAKDTTPPASGIGILGYLSGVFRTMIGGLGSLQARAPGLSGTANVPANNAQSTFTIPLGKLGGNAAYANGVFDARLMTIAINNQMYSQPITAAALVLSDRVGSSDLAITYPLAGVNIAYLGGATFVVLLNQGLYNNVSLNITLAGVPTVGSAEAQVYVQGAGAPQTILSGSKGALVSVASTPVPLSGYLSGVADITLGWGTGHFEASYDNGATYKVLGTRYIRTGRTFFRIDMRGRYFLDLRGATHLKYVADYTLGATGANAATVMLLPTFEAPSPEVYRHVTKRYAPSKPFLVGAMTLTTSGRNVSDVELATGTLYAYAGPNISKSVDYGVTWVNVISAGQPWGAASFNNGAMKKLRTGSILAVFKNNAGNTEIYLSDASEANFTLKYSFPFEGEVSPGFGLSVCGDVILLAPYKQQVRQATDPLHVHLSKDGGSTWSIIHTAPATQSWHYHDAVFDPYRQRIWIISGDQYTLANVYFSDDWGATWETLWTDGAALTQFTTIHPMPDVVLFGTDQAGFQGAYRYYRQSGDKGSAAVHVLEPCASRKVPGAVGDATYRGHQFWDAGATYWATKSPTSILATKDAETFYQVWSTADSTIFVNTIFGVDKNGKLVAAGTVGGSNAIMVADAPTWVEF